MNPRLKTKRSEGFTLLEVLISAAVIMIGIFGIAGAVALSEQLVKQSFRSDMAANCGRAALETMLAQDWIEELNDDGLSSTSGYNYNWSPGFGSAPNVKSNAANKMFTEDFDCADHLKQSNEGVDLESNPPQYDTSLNGDYSWVGTVRKIENKDYCEVSAAVTYKRSRSENGGFEINKITGVSITDSYGVLSVQGTFGSGDVEEFKAGQYVYMVNSAGSYGHWYRIENIYSDGGTIYMQFHGMQWLSGKSGATIYTPGGVVGVYTQFVPIQVRR